MPGTAPTDDLLCTLLSCIAVIYFIYHAWTFDHFKCLRFTRTSWSKPGMVWLNFTSIAFFAIFGGLFVWLKYRNGYSLLPGFGYLPTPWELWTKRDRRAYIIADWFLVLGWSAYDSVNLEEWLFWLSLMSSVRPKDAKAQPKSLRFLRRRRQIVWAVLTVMETVAHVATPFIHNSDLNEIDARLFLTGGCMGVLTCGLSIVLAYRFPKFLEQVKASGASSDVLTKLYLYHTLNIFRSVFRTTFVLPMVIMGADAYTEKKVVNLSPFASDMMYQVAVMSFFLSVILSIQLYLPVDWGKTSQTDPEGFGKRERRANIQQGSFFLENAKGLGHGGIDVLDPYNHRQLVSLMRERGGVEISDEDDSPTQERGVEEGKWGQEEPQEVPEAFKSMRLSARKSMINEMPQFLNNFQGPLLQDHPQTREEARDVHVVQEVHVHQDQKA